MCAFTVADNVCCKSEFDITEILDGVLHAGKEYPQSKSART